MWKLSFPAQRGIPQFVLALLVCSVEKTEGNFDSGLPPMDKDYLILKRASATRSSGQWSEDDFDCLPMAKLSAASSRQTPRRSEKRGCGLSPSGTMRIAHRRTAMLQRERLPWPPLPRAGDGSSSTAIARSAMHTACWSAVIWSVQICRRSYENDPACAMQEPRREHVASVQQSPAKSNTALERPHWAEISAPRKHC